MSARRLAEQQLKAELQLDALTSAGIDAMVPGQSDLALGVAWLQEKASAVKAPYVAANLTCNGVAPFPPHVQVDVAGVAVVVIGVLSPSEPVPTDCAVSDPRQAVDGALRGLPDAELVVLLSRLSEEGDEALAGSVPRLDLVVGGGSKTARSEPQILANDAARVEVGSRGKKLGLAAVHWVPGGSGFRAAGAVDAIEAELDRLRKRQASAVAQLERDVDPGSKDRQQRRLDFYATEVPRLEAELEAARAAGTRQTHGIELTLRGLDASVSDHPETAEKLAQTLKAVEALERKPVAVEDLQGL